MSRHATTRADEIVGTYNGSEAGISLRTSSRWCRPPAPPATNLSARAARSAGMPGRRLRRNGHFIRNNRVSELLAALRQEAPSINGPPSLSSGVTREPIRTRQDPKKTQRG